MARQPSIGWAWGWFVSAVFWSWVENKLWFPWPFSKRKMKCGCTLGSHAPATFSESAKLSCTCPSFSREKFTEPTRYVVFSLSNSLFFVCFLRLSDLSHTQEQAGSMPSTQAVAPSPSHNRDGSEKVRTFNKRTHRHKPFDLQRIVSVLWLRYAQLHDLVEVWALTGECSPPVRECWPPDRNRPIFRSNLCQFRAKFAWDSLWVFFALDHEFFLRNDKYRQEAKISSKCPTSAIASPHVKYVKGC